MPSHTTTETELRETVSRIPPNEDLERALWVLERFGPGLWSKESLEITIDNFRFLLEHRAKGA